MASVGAGLSGWASAPAGATGILPPANPPANIAPSSGDWLASIDSAAADEGVGPMPLAESELAALPEPEQVFAVLNYERIDRGLPPIEYMTTQLNFLALAGAEAGTDPNSPTHGDRWRARHLWRRRVGRRHVIRAPDRLLLDVRGRLRRRVDVQRHLQPGHAGRLLGPPRHHLARVRQLPERPAGVVHGRRLLLDRLSGRVVLRPHGELVRGADRRHPDVGPGGGRSRLTHTGGRHRADGRRQRLLGGRGQRDGGCLRRRTE